MNDFDNKQICSYKDIDRFGFTCDVCGRKVNGCHIVNGMSFCEKCYQETFGKYNQQNEIQQLKQQLDQANKRLKGAIVLPVKVGDTIYVVPSETNYRLNIVNGREEQNKVYEWTVSEIRYNKYGYSVVCDVGDAQFYCNYQPPKNLCGHFDTEKYYGETWFSTLEEAEKKLQELRGGK